MASSSNDIPSEGAPVAASSNEALTTHRRRHATRPPPKRRQQFYIADNARQLLWRTDDGNRFYMLHGERPCVVVLPSVAVRRFGDLRPLDLHSFWSDISKFTYANHISSRQIIVHENDWRVSPHVHAKISISTDDANRLQTWLDDLYASAPPSD